MMFMLPGMAAEEQRKFQAALQQSQDRLRDSEDRLQMSQHQAQVVKQRGDCGIALCQTYIKHLEKFVRQVQHHPGMQPNQLLRALRHNFSKNCFALQPKPKPAHLACVVSIMKSLDLFH